MNSFGHRIAFQWRLVAVMQAVGRGFVVFSTVILLAPVAIGPAKAQRAVLFDEDPSGPNGNQFLGSVVWRTEITKSAGQPDDAAVYADVDIPARKLKMTLALKRNLDKSLPASQVVELRFRVPPDFAGGGIGNVPGLLMKSNETTSGVALAALSVKVTEGFFLVGLSNAGADAGRNQQLLLGRAWFDIPLVYVDKQRAILAIEKGASGDQAITTAFLMWAQYPLAVQAAPVTPDSHGGVGGYVVQVSSQRSEEDAQASYKVLQAKFPNVLGAWAPIITRADTSANGMFYRAAVGPFKTADEATQFCDTLKTAGGQCVVQRN